MQTVATSSIFNTYNRKWMAKKKKELKENFLSHITWKLNKATKPRERKELCILCRLFAASQYSPRPRGAFYY